MELSKEQVKHIANLARLDLSSEELELYAGQLKDILGYIEQLQEIDISGVEPTAQVTGQANVYREDDTKDWPKEEVKNALNEAPDFEDNQIKVKRVLE